MGVEESHHFLAGELPIELIAAIMVRELNRPVVRADFEAELKVGSRVSDRSDIGSPLRLALPLQRHLFFNGAYCGRIELSLEFEPPHGLTDLLPSGLFAVVNPRAIAHEHLPQAK